MRQRVNERKVSVACGDMLFDTANLCQSWVRIEAYMRRQSSTRLQQNMRCPSTRRSVPSLFHMEKVAYHATAARARSIITESVEMCRNIARVFHRSKTMSSDGESEVDSQEVGGNELQHCTGVLYVYNDVFRLVTRRRRRRNRE